MTTLAVLAIAGLIAAGSGGNTTQQPHAKALLTEPAVQALNKARSAEQDGRAAEAVRFYREAATAGSGEAAKRLADVYWNGRLGTDRDMAESMRWSRVAEVHGETVAQAVRLR